MSYFHATFVERIDSILLEGLRVGADRNFPESFPGVYLSTDPVLAIGFLIEHAVDRLQPDNPSEHLKRFRIIVVDSSRIDDRWLAPDPQIDEHPGFFWLYRGTIDITGMPILDVDQVMSDMMVDKFA